MKHNTISIIGIFIGAVYILGNAYQFFATDLPETTTINGIIVGLIVIIVGVVYDRQQRLRNDVNYIENIVHDKFVDLEAQQNEKT